MQSQAESQASLAGALRALCHFAVSTPISDYLLMETVKKCCALDDPVVLILKGSHFHLRQKLACFSWRLFSCNWSEDHVRAFRTTPEDLRDALNIGRPKLSPRRLKICTHYKQILQSALTADSNRRHRAQNCRSCFFPKFKYWSL